MVPDILILLLTLIGGFVNASNIVKEKEIGTIEQINVRSIKKWQFIFGELIPFCVVEIIPADRFCIFTERNGYFQLPQDKFEFYNTF